MELTTDKLNYTPIFSLHAEDGEPWRRVWGAVRVGDRWVWPAYFPFGMWVVNDLKVVAPWLKLSQSAKEAVANIHKSHARVVKTLADYAANKEVEVVVPDGFKFHLPPFPHQRLGIALGVESWRLFYLWDMRTGKTKTLIEIMRILRARGQFKRALVVGPPIVRPVWEIETEVHSDRELSTYAWEPSDPERAVLAAKADIVTVTYAGTRIERDRAAKMLVEANDLFRRKAPKDVLAAAARAAHNPLLDLDYDMIVGDESHQFGNWESQQTQAVIELSAKAARRYALSGTAGDQPGKFYPQLRFLSPGLMPLDWSKFQERFFVYSKKVAHAIVGFRHLDDMNAKVDKVATRMKQADCVKLPERTFTDLKYELGPIGKTRYNELVRDMRLTELPAALEAYLDPEFDMLSEEDNGIDQDSPPAAILFRVPHGAARVTKLLQITSGFVIKGKDLSICDKCPNLMRCVEESVRPYTKLCVVAGNDPPREIIRDVENPKLDLFKNLIDGIFDEDSTAKIIGWGVYTQEIEDMAAVCRERKLKYRIVDASSIAKVRALQTDFRDDPGLKVVLGQVSSGIGIDLTPANHMIFYALPWDRIQYRQALERNSGPKQTRRTFVYRLLARDTIAEYVAVALNFKDRVAFTLSEKIACSTCFEQTRCAKEGFQPFRKGCIYQADVDRPQVSVEELA